MLALHYHDVLPQLCKLQNKWGCYITFETYGEDTNYSWDEVLKLLPFLKDPRVLPNSQPWLNIIFDGCGYFFVDTKQELDEIYQLVVKVTPEVKTARGNIVISIHTCSNTGQPLTDNY